MKYCLVDYFSAGAVHFSVHYQCTGTVSAVLVSIASFGTIGSIFASLAYFVSVSWLSSVASP